MILFFIIVGWTIYILERRSARKQKEEIKIYIEQSVQEAFKKYIILNSSKESANSQRQQEGQQSSERNAEVDTGTPETESS